MAAGSRGAGQQALSKGALAQRQSRMGMIGQMQSRRNLQDGMFHCPVCDEKLRLPGQIRGHMQEKHPEHKTKASPTREG